MTPSNATPTAKVATGGAVGFITALIMWGITASGVSVPDAVLAGVPWLAGTIAAYLTPDKLVRYGRILQESLDHEEERTGRHEDNGNGIEDDAGTTL